MLREVALPRLTRTTAFFSYIPTAPQACALGSFDDIVDRIRNECGPEDVVLVMGAGTITELAARLVVDAEKTA